MGFVGGLEGPDDFDELHDGDGVHEVHADDLGGAFGGVGELGDGDGGGVAGDDGLGLEDLVEGCEQGLLDVEILDDGLNRGEPTSTAKSTSLSLKWPMSSVKESLPLNSATSSAVILLLACSFFSHSPTNSLAFLRETELES